MFFPESLLGIVRKVDAVNDFGPFYVICGFSWSSFIVLMNSWTLFLCVLMLS